MWQIHAKITYIKSSNWSLMQLTVFHCYSSHQTKLFTFVKELQYVILFVYIYNLLKIVNLDKDNNIIWSSNHIIPLQGFMIMLNLPLWISFCFCYLKITSCCLKLLKLSDVILMNLSNNFLFFFPVFSRIVRSKQKTAVDEI